MKNLFIIGSGGHAKVILDSLDTDKYLINIIDFYKWNNSKNFEYLKKNYPINSISNLSKFKPSLHKDSLFYVAIGNNSLREKYYDYFKPYYSAKTIVDKTAILSNSIKIGKGTYIGKRVILNTNVKIRDNCIINTSSIVEHDSNINDHTHICPGTIIAGSVKIGKNVTIGIGAKILPNISIGNNCIISPGSVINKNLKKNTTTIQPGLKSISN